MADVKISQLPAATTPLTGSEEVPLVQSGVTKKATVASLSVSQTLQTVTNNGAITTNNSTFNGANIGTYSGIPAVTSVGSSVGLANSTNAVVLLADAWRGAGNNTNNLGASGTNWNNVYATTYNVGAGTASITASGNNLVLNAVAAAVAGVGLAPATTNLYYLGGSTLKWKGLYLSDGDLNWNSYGIPAPAGSTTTFLRNDGTWAVPAGGGGGSGTVTSVSVVSANGFAGTVATATTTPAITLTTSITGVLKGNGTAISAATAGSDYVAPGGALGTPSSGTLTNATGLPLTTGVTGLLPVANGGTGTSTPTLLAGTNVTITGTWPNQTINSSGGGGGSGTVTSVAVSGGTTGLTTSGGPITTSGTITLAGTLAIANGGTNSTAAATAGAISYGTGTAFAFTAAGTSGYVLQSNGASAPTWRTPTEYATVTDDTTTAAVRYPLFSSSTSGNLTAEFVSSTKLKYTPSTGALTASQFIIAP
jgi:hypothetical protein